MSKRNPVKEKSKEEPEKQIEMPREYYSEILRKAYEGSPYEPPKVPIICTMCEKEFDFGDLEYYVDYHNNRFDFTVGYPSKHDEDHFKFDLCIDCLDRVIDTISPLCKTEPVIEENLWEE